MTDWAWGLASVGLVLLVTVVWLQVQVVRLEARIELLERRKP